MCSIGQKRSGKTRRAVQKAQRIHSALASRLNRAYQEQTGPCTNGQSASATLDKAGRRRAFDNRRCQNLEWLSPPGRVGSRPGRVGASHALNRRRGEGPVDTAVLLLDQATGRDIARQQALIDGRNSAGKPISQCLHQQIAALHSQTPAQRSGRIVGQNGLRCLAQRRAGVHSLIHEHDSDAGLSATVEDCGGNG